MHCSSDCSIQIISSLELHKAKIGAAAILPAVQSRAVCATCSCICYSVHRSTKLTHAHSSTVVVQAAV
eukprot:17083-Heterococcus_DN1.PRE.3